MAKRKHIFTTDYAETLLSGLTSDAAWKRIEKDPKYHVSYEAILDFAQELVDDCGSKREYVLACATYGWMPTILDDLSLENITPNAPIATIRSIKTKKEAIRTIEHMNSASPINNSWIGASKFMHFLNPDVFPIWDTRVAEKFSQHCINYTQNGSDGTNTESMPKAYLFANKKTAYLNYTKFILEQKDKKYPWIQCLKNSFEELFQYRPTSVRCLELMLFAKGRP